MCLANSLWRRTSIWLGCKFFAFQDFLLTCYVLASWYLSRRTLYKFATFIVSCVKNRIWGLDWVSTVFMLFRRRSIMSSRTSYRDFSSPRCVETFFSVQKGIESTSISNSPSLSREMDVLTARLMFSMMAFYAGSAPFSFISSFSFLNKSSFFSSRPTLVSPDKWFLARSLCFWRKERRILVFSAVYKALTFACFSRKMSICLLISSLRYALTVGLSPT